MRQTKAQLAQENHILRQQLSELTLKLQMAVARDMKTDGGKGEAVPSPEAKRTWKQAAAAAKELARTTGKPVKVQ